MRGGEAGAASAGGSRAEARQPSITLACSGRRRCEAMRGEARTATTGRKSERARESQREPERELSMSTLHAWMGYVDVASPSFVPVRSLQDRHLTPIAVRLKLRSQLLFFSSARGRHPCLAVSHGCITV
jgi:hypothetical protein